MIGIMLDFFTAAQICIGVAAASYLWYAWRKSSRAGTWATMMAWMAGIFLSVSLAIRWYLSGHAPYSNQFEFATAFSFGLIAVYLYVEHRYRLKALGAVVMPVGFGLMTYASTLPKEVTQLIPALQSPILTFHVAMAVIAYGCFAVAFGAAALYLIQGESKPTAKPAPTSRPELQLVGVGGGKIESMHLSGVAAAGAATLTAAPAVAAVATIVPKGRPFRSWLPSRETLDEIGFHAVTIGFPAQALLLVLGAWWGSIAWGRYWGWDPKETAALVTWLIYGVYLHTRISRGLKGSGSAWLLIAGFVAVLFTYYGNLFLGGLHAYSGL